MYVPSHYRTRVFIGLSWGWWSKVCPYPGYQLYSRDTSCNRAITVMLIQ
jgi:hypothetical protein